MIGEFGEVYVLDWGIAVSLFDDPSGRLPAASQAKDIAGTPHYMAPGDAAGGPERLLAAHGRLPARRHLLRDLRGRAAAQGGRRPRDGDEHPALGADLPGELPRRGEAHLPARARARPGRAASRAPSRCATPSTSTCGTAARASWRTTRSRAWPSCRRPSRAQAPGDDRKLAVANLLGECRFGYHAALQAWPANEAARAGLDRALLMVIDHELAEGEPPRRRDAAARGVGAARGHGGAREDGARGAGGGGRAPPPHGGRPRSHRGRADARVPHGPLRPELDGDAAGRVGVRAQHGQGVVRRHDGAAGGGVPPARGRRVRVGARDAHEDAAQPAPQPDLRPLLRRAVHPGGGRVARGHLGGAHPPGLHVRVGPHVHAARGVDGALVRPAGRHVRAHLPRRGRVPRRCSTR